MASVDVRAINLPCEQTTAATINSATPPATVEEIPAAQRALSREAVQLYHDYLGAVAWDKWQILDCWEQVLRQVTRPTPELVGAIESLVYNLGWPEFSSRSFPLLQRAVRATRDNAFDWVREVLAAAKVDNERRPYFSVEREQIRDAAAIGAPNLVGELQDQLASSRMDVRCEALRRASSAVLALASAGTESDALQLVRELVPAVAALVPDQLERTTPPDELEASRLLRLWKKELARVTPPSAAPRE